MLPSEVKNAKLQDATEFDNFGNPVKVRLFTFFVNDHGPFTEKFYVAEQDTPAIERRINDRVEQLRALGVIPQK